MSVIISGKGCLCSLVKREHRNEVYQNAELMILVHMLIQLAIPKSLLKLILRKICNLLVQLYGIRLCMTDFLSSTCNATS